MFADSHSHGMYTSYEGLTGADPIATDGYSPGIGRLYLFFLGRISILFKDSMLRRYGGRPTVAMSVPRRIKLGMCMAAAFTLFNLILLSPRLYHHYRKASWLETYPLQTYGNGSLRDSLPVSETLFEKAMFMRRQCKDSLLGTRIATVTAHFSDSDDPDAFYRGSLRTHVLHGLVHQSQLHVLSTPIIDDMWNKQAFLQLVILNEMVKPPKERLEWIFWADRDTVVLDYCRSPASFIPELQRSNDPARDEAKYENINLLISNDWNGLNAGVFIIRVNEWSVNFLSDVIAFRHYKPDIDLPFVEQTAMERLLGEDRYKKNVVYVPQHWINNYKTDSAQDFIYREENGGLGDWVARRGDFIVHFAGLPDKNENIMDYSSVGEEVFDLLRTRDVLRNISMDIEDFWRNYSHGRN